jgi:hypothetical protein
MEGPPLEEAAVPTATMEELGDVTAGTGEAGDVRERPADGSGDEDGDAGPELKELGAALLNDGTDDDGVAVGTETGIIENDNPGEELPGEGKGMAERDGMTAEEVIRTADEDRDATGEEATGEQTTGEESTGTGMTEDAGTLPMGELEGVALGDCTGPEGEATTELD